MISKNSAKIEPDFSPEVSQARSNGAPVVALESTIITHGLPHPVNLETAKRAEDEVRARGAVPATIAIMDGRLKVGLEADELARIADPEAGARKVGLQDLAACLMSGTIGGTTVAATMRIAAYAGIHVFATGGIGGVHRGAEQTFDISGDLTELGRTPVAVVSAGFKSILDLGLTVEYLETLGVPVIGYGTDVLPAFYVRGTDFAVSERLDTPEQVAGLLRTHWSIGAAGGIVIANPIPHEHSLNREMIEQAVTEASHKAETRGIAGKDLTPYLLARISELTGAASLNANQELVFSNARVAAEISVAMGAGQA